MRSAAVGVARQGHMSAAVELAGAIPGQIREMRSETLADLVRVLRAAREGNAATMPLTAELWQRGTSWYY